MFTRNSVVVAFKYYKFDYYGLMMEFCEVPFCLLKSSEWSLRIQTFICMFTFVRKAIFKVYVYRI